MIVPIHWYMFVNYLPNEIERSGSLESAFKNWKRLLPQSAKDEVRTFLAQAAACRDDCWTLYCPDLDESLIIVPEDGQSCEEYYVDLLMIFDRS